MKHRCKSVYFHLLVCNLEEKHEGHHYDEKRKLEWLRRGENDD